MTESNTTALSENKARLERLQSYLQSDAHNLNLLGDTALAAFETEQTELAKELFHRYTTLAEPSDALLNMAGLIALRETNISEAISHFTKLSIAHPASVEITYNLAYAEGLAGMVDGALERLGKEVTSAYPPALALKMRLLHHAGRVDEAIHEGTRVAGVSEIEGLLAVLYLDKGDLSAAAIHAQAAGDQTDALTTLGMLELESGSTEVAHTRFERLVVVHPRSGRAWLGMGLASLANQSIDDARVSLDRAARLLERHPGSWLACGWAHLLGGFLGDARAAFEKAAHIDRNFAEAHGSLAVVAIRQGDKAAARKLIAVATRLDERCLSAALAQSELLREEGDVAGADQIRAAAMHAPNPVDGVSIYELLLRRGAISGGSSSN